MSLSDEPLTWPVVSSTDLHRDDWLIALRADRVRRPGAAEEEPFRRLVLEHPGAVVVLAIDDRERVCCVRQYRHPAGGVFVELPAGLRDTEGEDPVETGRRELLEEAELEAEDWRPLFELYPSPGITAERQVFLLARGLSHADRGDFAPEHEEAEIEVVWVPVEELIDAILDGRVSEAPIAVAVLAYDSLRRRGRL